MRILYITTIGITMGFFPAFIKQLLDEGHTVDIAANENDTKVPSYYRKWGCRVYPLSCSRSPLKKGNIDAVYQIRKIVRGNHYDLVHCHTPIAAMCTRLACRPLRKHGVRVFYTAHGFHFYKGAPRKNWLIYYPIEMFCSYFTDVLITINKEDYALAKKKFHAKKVEYVAGVGIDTKKFGEVQVDREKKRAEIGVPPNAFALMSVGELNENKNHSTVIKAVALLNKPHIHYMVVGRGDQYDALLELSKELEISNQIHLLGYRNDIADLYHAADVCVFPSIREGLGVAALEGLASGLPLIASFNRGTLDYAKDGVNAKLCKYDSPDEFSEAISFLMREDAVRVRMGRLNIGIAKRFDVKHINQLMGQIYTLTDEVQKPIRA